MVDVRFLPMTTTPPRTPSPRLRWLQFRLRTLLFVLTLCSAVVLLAAACCVLVVGWVGGGAIVHAVLVGKTGPVTNPADWPEPLQNLCKDFGATPPQTSKIQVQCLCHGMDHEYVWRMDPVPGLFEHIQKSWRLAPVSNPNWRVLRGKSSLSGESTPSWWSPTLGDSTTFYECPASLAGEKGHRFRVAFDRDQDIVFVHYWFNF